MLFLCCVQDLNVTSRALVLDALQQLKLSAHKDRRVMQQFAGSPPAVSRAVLCARVFGALDALLHAQKEEFEVAPADVQTMH